MQLDDWFLNYARISNKQHTRIRPDDKMTFFQQLSSLVTSGTPVWQSLEICAEQNLSRKLSGIIREIAEDVSGGSTLEAAMANHPRTFEPHWIALIGTGEVSGQMGRVLIDLNDQIRESRETQRKISGALIYPAVLMLVSILVIVVMLWFVVPTFADMFAEMNAELPAITKFVVAASEGVARYGLYGIAVVIGLVIALRQYLKTDKGRRRIGAIGLAIPVIGDLMVQSAMYRFAVNLALLLKSGVPILETLNALSSVFRGNPVYRDAILQAHDRVAAGRPLADSLDSSQLFTNMLTHMVYIGEESSQLATVMDQLAPFYREKTHSFLNRVTKLLEPSIILVMGFVISIVLLAIYVPMFEMSGKVN